MKTTKITAWLSLVLTAVSVSSVINSASAQTTSRILPLPHYGVTMDTIENLTAQIDSIKQLPYPMVTRVVLDPGTSPTYYAPALKSLYPVSGVMAEIADSYSMSSYTVLSYTKRCQKFVPALNPNVDIWEIGNEVNGAWLGKNVFAKILAAYGVVAPTGKASALTFFYMGEPNDPAACIDAPGNDMFSWITQQFRLDLPEAQRPVQSENLRKGLQYALLSWYPKGCPNLKPNWPVVFQRLATIFPSAKVGFGELGTATPENGSPYEINLIKTFYPMAKDANDVILPKRFIGGYFWWNFSTEMVPTTKPLWSVLRDAMLLGPAPKLSVLKATD